MLKENTRVTLYGKFHKGLISIDFTLQKYRVIEKDGRALKPL